MSYVMWLAGLSAIFAILEQLQPRHRQAILRPGVSTDLLHLVFNGHFLGIGLAMAAAPLMGRLDPLHLGVAADLPPWAQFVVALLTIDLLQWCIHNMLHRVPALWELHKVHHSIETMDWMGSMRFHWSEAVIYKSLTYPLLALLGFQGDVLFVLAVVGTAIGHFNHSNLRISIGPLKYLVNSPEMHVWHHVHPDSGPPNRNFGINLSVWDWIFGTAHLPPTPPERLAFEEIEVFPTSWTAQLLHPLCLRLPSRR